MRLFGFDIRRGGPPPEARAQAVSSMSPQDFYTALGIPWGADGGEVVVTIETALGVPAISAGVNFLAGTLAGLPLNLFRRAGEGRKRVTDKPLAHILHDAPNEAMSSFEWRKYTFEQVLTGGRAFTFIERGVDGQVTNLWPLDPAKVTITRTGTAKSYTYRDGGRTVRYEAAEVIDLPFMLKADGLGHRGPLMMNRDVIGLAIAVTRFGSRFFQNGGVPPFAVTGDFRSGQAMDRAAEDMAAATLRSAKERRMALVLPRGLEIKTLGTDAEKSQLTETKRFLVEEIARIFSLPPTFLQDLTHGTFSNTEQQDLHLVKHTVKRWVEAFEQELNLKLFGRKPGRQFVEMNMDGLLRGDFKTRMEGYARAIQTGQMTPNEARRMENRPDAEGGDGLFLQGAMVPITDAGRLPAGPDGTALLPDGDGAGDGAPEDGGEGSDGA